MTSSDKTVTDPGMGSALTAYIAPTAQVSDWAWVYGEAWVSGRARVSGDARVYGQAWVSDRAWVHGQAWVSDRARVSGDARVYGQVQVHGDARIAGQGDIASVRHYLTIGPVGSEDRTVTVHRHYDRPNSATWGHLVIAGFWMGTLADLEARITTDDDHQRRANYERLITLARPRVAEWAAEPLTDADHARWGGSW